MAQHCAKMDAADVKISFSSESHNDIGFQAITWPMIHPKWGAVQDTWRAIEKTALHVPFYAKRQRGGCLSDKRSTAALGCLQGKAYGANLYWNRRVTRRSAKKGYTHLTSRRDDAACLQKHRKSRLLIGEVLQRHCAGGLTWIKTSSVLRIGLTHGNGYRHSASVRARGVRDDG
jgi:hypothetical protein